MVLEQDAASHRGIDDVRQLQETIAIAPSEGLIRVVILDEVHMFSNDAFNALLKVLEEPPSRVVFILATTELHKVPATVQSRTQIIRFQQASPEEIAFALQGIASQEGFDLPQETAQTISQAAKGSFRDAVKYLEQGAQGGKLDEQQLMRVLGGTSGTAELLRSLASRDAVAVSEFFQKSRQAGESLAFLETHLLEQAQQRLHRAIARNEGTATVQKILALLEHLATRLGGSEPLPGLRFELACLSWCYEEEQSSQPQNKEKRSPQVPKTSVPETEVACAKEELLPSSVTASPQEVRRAGHSGQIKEKHGGGTLTWEKVQAEWPAFLLSLRLHSQALEALIRNAHLEGFQENRIQLVLGLPFHKEQLESSKYAAPLRQALQEIFSPEVQLEYRIELDPVLTQNHAETENQSDDQLLQAVEAAVLSLGM